MKRSFVSLLVAGALTLSACTAMNNIGHGADSDTADKKLNYDLTEITDAFLSAHSVALLFTGYAGDVYGQESYYHGSETDGLRYDTFTVCETYDELTQLTHSVFTPVLATELLGKNVYDGAPLYIENDGVLYRFGGYVALLGGEPESVIVKSAAENGDGTVNVAVVAEFLKENSSETVTVSHNYTCVKDGDTYKFTGDFPVLVELAIDNIYG